MKGVECWTTLEEIKRYFNGQEACTFLVGHYASIEIVLVLYRKMSSQFSALFHCSLQTLWCKFIIFFYDNGAQSNVKITYNNKLFHYREYFTIALITVYAAERQGRLIYVHILRKRKKYLIFLSLTKLSSYSSPKISLIDRIYFTKDRKRWYKLTRISESFQKAVNTEIN